MKLRIKGATLRLRLTQGEVTELEERGAVEEEVPFTAESRLVYRLRSDATAPAISASYQGNVLEIRLPQKLAHQWCTTDLVTLSHAQPVAQGALRITLEKDFACLEPRTDEDESDNFPHPQGESKRC